MTIVQRDTSAVPVYARHEVNQISFMYLTDSYTTEENQIQEIEDNKNIIKLFKEKNCHH